MSLRPRRVDFESTWDTLKDTVTGVITCGSVARATWNDRFSYPLSNECMNGSQLLTTISLFHLIRRLNDCGQAHIFKGPF